MLVGPTTHFRKLSFQANATLPHQLHRYKAHVALSAGAQPAPKAAEGLSQEALPWAASGIGVITMI